MVISTTDTTYLQMIRENVSKFIQACAEQYDNGLLLDIAPQKYQGAKEWFCRAIIKTLDIDPESGADYIADITKHTRIEPIFDSILCTEVIEHVVQPFDAITEIHRLLKPGGMLFLTTPFNFRIHGPLPDCWRFTEHGLRVLMQDKFEVISLESLESDRPLNPIHYTLVAKKIDNGLVP